MNIFLGTFPIPPEPIEPSTIVPVDDEKVTLFDDNDSDTTLATDDVKETTQGPIGAAFLNNANILAMILIVGGIQVMNMIGHVLPY